MLHTQRSQHGWVNCSSSRDAVICHLWKTICFNRRSGQRSNNLWISGIRVFSQRWRVFSTIMSISTIISYFCVGFPVIYQGCQDKKFWPGVPWENWLGCYEHFGWIEDGVYRDQIWCWCDEVCYHSGYHGYSLSSCRANFRVNSVLLIDLGFNFTVDNVLCLRTMQEEHPVLSGP